MIRAILFAVALAGVFTTPAGAREPVQIVNVIDGDTFRAVVRGQVEKIRIADLDAPEVSRQACPAEEYRGWAATRVLALTLWRAHTVTIEPEGRGRYGRLLARVYADGRDVNDVLIGQGLAAPYREKRNWCR